MIPSIVNELIKISILEDAPYGDITSDALFPEVRMGKLIIKTEEACIFTGNIIVNPLIKEINPSLKAVFLVEDGDRVDADKIALIIEGETRDLLRAERLLLNFISKLSGISTLTHHLIQKIDKTSIRLTDTRKTTPGWRFLEKYAVRMGGGYNHRFSLSDGILIKDNHKIAVGGIRKAIQKIKKIAPHNLCIEVEVDNLEEYKEAIEEKPDIILLDNFTPEEVEEALKYKPPNLKIEVSGGITPENFDKYLIPGVDIISSGFITYNARWCRFTAEIE